MQKTHQYKRPEDKSSAALPAAAVNASQGSNALPLTDNRDAVVQKKNNTGLPDNLKSGIENLSGRSMDDVKVHYHSSKPAQLQAHAFAQGTNIHLAPGQEKHLPHEAWHVVQQKQGRVKPTMQMKGSYINDNRSLEQEADAKGAEAASGKVVQRMLRGGRGGGGGGRGGERGRGRGRGVPPPVGARYAAQRWEDAEPIEEEQSPYVSAVREGASGSHPARLSLAYAVHDPTTDGEPNEEGRAVSLHCGNQNLSEVASCHPTAAHLVQDLGEGPITSVGNFEGSAASKLSEEEAERRAPHEDLAASIRAVRDGGRPQVIRYTHGAHSIALMAHSRGVESLESWAGGAENEEDAERLQTSVSAPLHESVLQPRPPLALDRAAELAEDLGHARKPRREAALDAFSSAGIGGFEAPGQRLDRIPRSLDRRNLRPVEEISDRVRGRIERADRDLAAAPRLLGLAAPVRGRGHGRGRGRAASPEPEEPRARVRHRRDSSPDAGPPASRRRMREPRDPVPPPPPPARGRGRGRGRGAGDGRARGGAARGRGRGRGR